MQQLANIAMLSTLVSVSNPIEVVKSRFQTMPELKDRGMILEKYKGIFDCVKNIRMNQGINGLWKGNSIGLMRFFPNQIVNFEVRNRVKKLLPNYAVSSVAAGVVGGWAASLLLYPLDTARIFIATSTKRTRETIKDLFNKIRVEGGRYLLRGYSGSLINIGLFRGTYFGVFDTLKPFTRSETQKWAAAYLSGLTAGFLVYPTETLRKKKILSLKAEKYNQLIFKTVKNQGVSGFYRGSSLLPIQSLCGAAVLMFFDSKQQKDI